METSPVTRVIRVLVVDDSAFVRKVMRHMLSRSPFIEIVGTARDGREALELVEELKPDVVTLDLNMPSADGLTFLRTQMERRPLPVIVVTTERKAGQQVLEALEAGAVDVVQKPNGLATEKLFDINNELLTKVKTAAGAQLRKQNQVCPTCTDLPPVVVQDHLNVDVIVIGASTGGPQALKYLVPRLPADLPVPLVMVLHMPIGYTELFARSLDEVSALEVREVRPGDVLRPGLALLASAGLHLTLRRNEAKEIVAHLDMNPLNTSHRPSVDVLFKSAAEIYGARTLGVVMTGMGCDGTEGAAWIKGRGGKVFTEAEESCVVYGMPRSIVDAGLCDRSVSLAKMAAEILESL